jgi:hypothetical protein
MLSCEQQSVARGTEQGTPTTGLRGVVRETYARSKCMKTHNTHHVQGVVNDVEWGETDKLNMSG